MAAVKELSTIFLFHFFLNSIEGKLLSFAVNMNSQDTVMICFIQYSCKCNNMAVACHQEVICDLLISFLKLYFGQIAAASRKSDYLTSTLATFFFTTQLQVQVFQIYIAKIHVDKV